MAYLLQRVLAAGVQSAGCLLAAAPTHYMAVALQIELSAKTTAELKDLLRDRGQQVKGTKAELIERIAPLLLREAAVTEAMDTLGCASLSLSSNSLPFAQYPDLGFLHHVSMRVQN